MAPASCPTKLMFQSLPCPALHCTLYSHSPPPSPSPQQVHESLRAGASTASCLYVLDSQLCLYHLFLVPHTCMVTTHQNEFPYTVKLIWTDFSVVKLILHRILVHVDPLRLPAAFSPLCFITQPEAVTAAIRKDKQQLQPTISPLPHCRHSGLECGYVEHCPATGVHLIQPEIARGTVTDIAGGSLYNHENTWGLSFPKENLEVSGKSQIKK